MPKREDCEDIYRAHVAGETFAAIGKRVGLSRSRVGQIVAREVRLNDIRGAVAACENWRDIPMRIVPNLSVRTSHALYAAGFQTIGEVVIALETDRLNHRDALKLLNFGHRCWVELIAWIAEKGIVLNEPTLR